MADSERDVFARRFKSLRLAGETQRSFAQRIGLTQPTVALYESGKRTPDIETLGRICRVCGCSADWLVGISDIKIQDTNTRGVCEYTGLDENAIDLLLEYKKTAPEFIGIINILMSGFKTEFTMLLSDLNLYLPFAAEIREDLESGAGEESFSLREFLERFPVTINTADVFRWHASTTFNSMLEIMARYAALAVDDASAIYIEKREDKALFEMLRRHIERYYASTVFDKESKE